MVHAAQSPVARAHDVHIRSDDVVLEGDFSLPAGARGVVLFAHGLGSSRHSPRNQFVASTIREANVGHTIIGPTRVWLQQTSAGANAALEIEASDGTKTLLRFRSPLPSEMVDGVVLD